MGISILRKRGSGELLLTVPSPTDLQLVVEEGVVAFNGTTNQPIFIFPGTELEGNLTCLYLVNNGIVCPGNSIGIMTTIGDYYGQDTLEIQVIPSGEISFVQVGGNAFLDPTLLVDPDLGLYLKGDQFTFLTAGGAVDGTYENLLSTQDAFQYSIHYFPQSVQLELTLNTVSFFGSTLTGNPQTILSVLNNATVSRGTDLFDVLSAINALDTPSSVQSALNQLAPTPFASIAWSDATTVYQISNAVSMQQYAFCDVPCVQNSAFDPTCCPAAKPNRVWFNVIGEKTNQNTVDSLMGFQTYTEGALVGYNRTFSNPLTLGCYVGYTHAHMRWDEEEGKTNTHRGYLGAYGSYCWKYGQLDASVVGTGSSHSIHRTIDFPGVHRTATSSPYGAALLGHLGASGYIPNKTVNLFPFAKVDLIGEWLGPVHETRASSINLRMPTQEFTFLHAEAGFLVSKPFCYSWGSWTPAVSLSWVYFGPITNTDIEGHFITVPERMVMQTSSHGFNGISPMASLGFFVGKSCWFSVAYKGEWSEHRQEQDIHLNLRIQF